MNNQLLLKLKRAVFLVFSILVISAASSLAQTKTEIVIAEQFTLQSEVLNEERTISVHLPKDYKPSSNKYPVLYLLDGRTHFQHAISAVNYLTLQRTIPDMVIVSVHNIDRSRDFSPVYDESIPTSGGADKFLSFLSDELMAHMKKKYKVSDFSLLLGHSFGGTFIAYSLLEKPELFDAYIAVSPYLMYADNYMVKQSKENLKLEDASKKYFYMTVGDEPRYFESLQEYSEIMEQQSPDELQFKYVKMEDENHMSTPYLTLFNGLKFVFSDWSIPRELMTKDLKSVDEHFATLSKKYGIEVHTPENIINALGYGKLQGGDMEAAIDIFEENVKRYSKSANVYDSLGEAYENNQQIDLAKKSYEKACKIGTATANANLFVYMENLERVKGM